MQIYKLYLVSVYDSQKTKTLMGKARTRKGIGRIIYKLKEEFGYGWVPYTRGWEIGYGSDKYEVVDFGCHSHLFLIKKEVM